MPLIVAELIVGKLSISIQLTFPFNCCISLKLHESLPFGLFYYFRLKSLHDVRTATVCSSSQLNHVDVAATMQDSYSYTKNTLIALIFQLHVLL